MSVRGTTSLASFSRSLAQIKKRRFLLVVLLAANLIAVAVLLAPSPSSQLGVDHEAKMAGEPKPKLQPIMPPIGDQRVASTVEPKGLDLSEQILRDAIPSSSIAIPSTSARNGTTSDLPSRHALRNQAHELLKNGSYEVAIELFKQVVEADGRLPQGLFAYEMAVGFEMLGEQSLAHRHYQLAAASKQRNLRQAAMFGQSRMLRDLGDLAEATHLLARLQLQTQNANGRETGIAGQVQFHWAELLVLERLRSVRSPAFSRNGRRGNRQHVIPPKVGTTNLSMNYTSLLSRDQPVHAPLTVSAKVLLHLAQPHQASANFEQVDEGIEVLGGERSSPHIAALRIRLNQIGVPQLLRGCCDALGYELTIPDDILQSLSTRSVAIDADDMTFSNLLRLVLNSTKSGWTYDDASHTLALQRISTSDSSSDLQSSAEFALRGALATSPNHEHAAAAFAMLGNLSFHRKQIDDAISQYRDVTIRYREPKTKQVVAFNMAKCLQLKEKRDEARQTFYSVIDQRTGHEVEPASHVFLGEMYLCERNSKAALREFTRAVALTKSNQLKGLASLALSLSYLQSGNSRMANSALMRTRSILREPRFQNAAALLSAYANYRSSKSDDETRRFGRAMTSAMAHVSAEDFFGATGFILLCDVYAELGMSGQVASVQQTAIETDVPRPLRDEYVFELGRYHLLESDHPNFLDAMQALRASGANQWPHQAQLELAEFALRQGQSAECIKICRRLVNASKTTQQKADGLRLLGRAYEKRKDHRNAAICFAGMLPKQTANLDAQNTVTVMPLNTPGG